MDLLTFQVSPEKGEVSACYQPAETPVALLVLGHGAGANMLHNHMQQLTDTLAQQNISTLRYNFPFMEKGSGRADNLEVCLDTIDAALKTAKELAKEVSPALPLYLAGHSFGGRMSSHYAAELKPDISGLVYFSFPLHPAKKPETKRARHLTEVQVPQLFVSGTRDTLAELTLLEPIVAGLKAATLYKIDTADHGFKILKRTRQSTEDVYSEAARAVASWLTEQLPKNQ